MKFREPFINLSKFNLQVPEIYVYRIYICNYLCVNNFAYYSTTITTVLVPLRLRVSKITRTTRRPSQSTRIGYAKDRTEAISTRGGGLRNRTTNRTDRPSPGRFVRIIINKKHDPDVVFSELLFQSVAPKKEKNNRTRMQLQEFRLSRAYFFGTLIRAGRNDYGSLRMYPCLLKIIIVEVATIFVTVLDIIVLFAKLRRKQRIIICVEIFSAP